MKVLLSLAFLALTSVAVSQHSTDSIQNVLRAANSDRPTVEYFLACMHNLPLEKSAITHEIGGWIIDHAKEDSLVDLQARAALELGKLNANSSNYAEAGRYLTLAQRIAEKKNLPIVLAEALNALGSVYGSNDQYEKEGEYYRRSFEISKANEFTLGMARAKYNLGNLQFSLYPKDRIQWQKGLVLMLDAVNLAKQANDTNSMITQSMGISRAYERLLQLDEAIKYLQEAVSLSKKNSSDFIRMRQYNHFGRLYALQKKYAESVNDLKKGLSIAEKHALPRWRCQFYTTLADTYEQMGNYKEANRYNAINRKMHETFVSQENFIAAADIQNRYETEKKDTKILLLAAENREKSILNTILIVAAVAVVIISFLGYLNFKGRVKISQQYQQLQKQKIAELEKDKQLSSIDAMLKGQEEERSRIAKELHDGLGSLLSGTKLSFMNMKETLVLSPADVLAFNRSLGMLDNTITDLRKIAQNLMPEALVKFGLKEALQDFCFAVEQSSGIKVRFQYFGSPRNPSNTATIYIYRIVQELVNNVVKHAEAKEMIVQLSVGKETINITVEDDGKGIDAEAARHSRGAGMNNINYRVQYLGGSIDIVSSAQKGTSVNIDLKA